VPGCAFGDYGLTTRLSFVDIKISSVDRVPIEYTYEGIKYLMAVLKKFLNDIYA